MLNDGTCLGSRSGVYSRTRIKLTLQNSAPLSRRSRISSCSIGTAAAFVLSLDLVCYGDLAG